MNFKLSHAIAQNMVLLEAPDGATIIAADYEHANGVSTVPAFPWIVGFSRQSVAPELFTMLQAAPLMYQQLTKLHDSFEAFLHLAEVHKATGPNIVVDMLQEACKGILIVQRTALEGVAKVSAEIDREAKISKKV